MAKLKTEQDYLELSKQLRLNLQGRDILRLRDFSKAELIVLLQFAKLQKDNLPQSLDGLQKPNLGGVIILEKPSLRTRVSFERALGQLGVQAQVLDGPNSAFSRGETVADTTYVLDKMTDVIIIRTFAQSKLEEIAQYASVPVINALTDSYHPCQLLADLLTVYEHKLGGEGTPDFHGLKFAYVGDGNNMSNSFAEAAAILGFDLYIGTPTGYESDNTIVTDCQEMILNSGVGLIEETSDFATALAEADMVITDTWTSMGSESESAQREHDFAGWMVDDAAMKLAKPDAIFLHCLPAHRGSEVSDSVMDGPQSRIYDEAGNRLHAQRALLSVIL